MARGTGGSITQTISGEVGGFHGKRGLDREWPHRVISPATTDLSHTHAFLGESSQANMGNPTAPGTTLIVPAFTAAIFPSRAGRRAIHRAPSGASLFPLWFSRASSLREYLFLPPSARRARSRRACETGPNRRRKPRAAWQFSSR